MGGFSYALIIASITSVITRRDMNAMKVSEQLDAVRSFVNNREYVGPSSNFTFFRTLFLHIIRRCSLRHSIPQHLGRQVQRHFRQFYSNKVAIDERKIFKEMSAALRKDVSMFLVSERMSDVKFIQNIEPRRWSKLFPLLNPTRFERNELVCCQGEEVHEMVIVISGSLFGTTRLSARSGKSGKLSLDREISNGDSINVLCIFKVWNRCVETVEAQSNVESYSLNADDFYEVSLLITFTSLNSKNSLIKLSLIALCSSSTITMSSIIRLLKK